MHRFRRLSARFEKSGRRPHRSLSPSTHSVLPLNMAKLSSEGLAQLERYVHEAGKTLPGAFVEVGTPDEVLLSTRAGRLDMLDPDSKAPDERTIYWFASTTKLLTSVRPDSSSAGVDLVLTFVSP